MGGRSVGRGQNLSHTDVGDGAWTWDWDWDCQTSEHLLLELHSRCWREDNTGACERALRVHAMGARLSVVCSALLWFNDAPHAALVLGRLAG